MILPEPPKEFLDILHAFREAGFPAVSLSRKNHPGEPARLIPTDVSKWTIEDFFFVENKS
jgi:hypothetical protein